MPQKSVGIGKTALPPVVRMGFALPLAIVLFLAAMPHALKLKRIRKGTAQLRRGRSYGRAKPILTTGGKAVLQRLLRQRRESYRFSERNLAQQANRISRLSRNAEQVLGCPRLRVSTIRTPGGWVIDFATQGHQDTVNPRTGTPSRTPSTSADEFSLCTAP